jgi:peptidoglycan hydrolase-like protein with peptidoglycan-binding domain
MKWLKLTEPRMNGPEVTRLQEMLMALGYDIGAGGPEGIYDQDTANAVKRFQKKHGLIADGSVGNLETWPFFLEVWKVHSRKHPANEPSVTFVDRRGQHDPPGLYQADKSPRVWTGEGDNVIRGVTLHQTGALISDDPHAFDMGNFHIVVLRTGMVVLTNPLEWNIRHAHGLSDSTIGIEFHGNKLGVHGDPSTVWNEGSEPTDMTPAQLKATEFLFSWLKNEFERNGGKWEFVHAHRQASKDRRADPGSEIWEAIGLRWIKELGATDGGPDFKIGDGMEIPKQWNPGYSTDY